MKIDSRIISALAEIEATRGVPREQIVDALAQAVKAAYEKRNGPTPNLEIEIDLAKATIEAYLSKTVTDKPTNPALEISLEEARALYPNEEIEIGDALLIETEIGDLGYWGVNTAKIIIRNLIRQAERDKILNEYKTKLYELVTCTVLYEERGDVFVETLSRVEGVIPAKERIPNEVLKPNQRVKCLLIEVRANRKSGPMLVLSRTHPDLIKRLMENEIPEVREGSIEVMAIARDPGFRSKVAIKSNLPELDPVGTCIGTRGVRITAISNELNEEKIDLVPWREDPFEFIAEALSPAKVASVEIFMDEKRAVVIVPDDQISLAIGKAWRNVKLASRLTKYFLEVRSMSEAESQVQVSGETAEGKKTSHSKTAEPQSRGTRDAELKKVSVTTSRKSESMPAEEQIGGERIG
mgnify:CR=1 FL=1